MRHRSGNNFTPAAVGFRRFRDFLQFAESLGVVALLQPARPNGDIEVIPATGGREALDSVAAHTRVPPRIRRDLWQAFVDWSSRWVRAFDTETDRVVTLPADATADDELATAPRKGWQDDTIRYRSIRPLSREDQLRWMKAFVDGLQSGDDKDRLHAALREDRPAAAFVEAIRANADLERAWHRKFTERVTAAITEWMLEQDLTVDIYRSSSRLSTSAASSRPEPTTLTKAVRRAGLDSAGEDHAEALRQQVLDAVGRMPLTDLLRLPIPAEYLLRR
jgi:hypothetical protein